MRETGGMTLVEFLLARIAEDEAEVRHRPRADMARDWVAVPTSGARVMVECEAKRAIVEAAASPRARGRLDGVLMALGVIYADHPDYRDEWRP